MSIMPRHWVRALAATGTITLIGCGSTGANGAPRLGFARMVEQPRADPYEASPFFPDDRTMRAPPAGTIAREQSVADALLATSASIVPTPPRGALGPQHLPRGASRFAIYCAVCHGERGDGESVVARDMPTPRPPSLLTARVRALSDGQLYALVTRGFGRMPSYASELPDTDRWAVIAHLRALEDSATAQHALSPSGGPARTP